MLCGVLRRGCAEGCRRLVGANLSYSGLTPFVQGSPGIGKTTCVLALAREMLGDSVKEGVLELNASDER